MSDPKTILLQLLDVAEKVSDPSLLLSVGFKLRHPEIFEASIQAFGSWEATLARLVVGMRDKDQVEFSGSLPSHTGSEENEISRERHPDADHPVWGLTSQGEVVNLAPEDLPLLPQPQPLNMPDTFGTLESVFYEGSFADVTVFTKRGLYFGLMKDLVPRLSNLDSAQRLQDSLAMHSEDAAVAVLASHRLRQKEERVLHVTSLGKAKATAAREYTPVVGRNGREAFLLNEGDLPIGVFVGDELEGLFCASSMGQGIHMSTRDIRTMGRKSVGVNVMKLSNEQDRVVSAFLTDGVEEVAVVTAQGYGKRLKFREFRKQGRGGAGMQVLRLNPNDSVVGVVPCSELSDFLLTTNTGKVWRVPSYVLAHMGRSARGKRIFEPQDGEQIVRISLLPCAGNVVRTVEHSNPENPDEHTLQTAE